MKTIYTFGYQGQDPKTLQDHIDYLNAWLVDIRYSPRSRNPVWKGSILQRWFGSHYIHVKELGNINYNNGGDIKIADLELGGSRIAAMMETAPVILMCVCADVHSCHRQVVAEAIAERYGWLVEHL